MTNKITEEDLSDEWYSQKISIVKDELRTDEEGL